MLAEMRWWLPLVFLIGCGGDDASGQIDAGDNGDGKHADAPACTGGAASMIDPNTGHCLILYVNLKTYASAKAGCEMTTGFHLVKIETANEQSLVTTLVGLDIAWIGGTDIATEGTYVWDDGTPITMFHWGTNQPDNGGGTAEEDCIGLDGARQGVWGDYPCMQESGTSVPYTYAYVCEHD
jgi:hypothetical protein